TDIGETYLYELREVIPAEPAIGMTYDATVYVAQVTIGDAGDGALTIDVVYTDDNNNSVAGADFTNIYEEEKPPQPTHPKDPTPSEPTDPKSPKDPKYPKNPKDPKYPKTPKDPSQKTSWIPRTGEQATAMYVGIGILVLAGILILILKRRKKDD
ncbi:MAG TPA: LPXTG cell wall anchor domain-containing protein, partial [Clostridiaceae bacterium]|nr:LPXTG cell wall anchor domain-containing protein [Clostridiaceae bacterium]